MTHTTARDPLHESSKPPPYLLIFIPHTILLILQPTYTIQFYPTQHFDLLTTIPYL